MAQRSGGGSGRARRRPHHVRATLKSMTYMFDGDGQVMGVVISPQRARRQVTREGGRPVTLYTRDVRVNNMARGKKLHGKRCEYLWNVQIVWLIEPAGTGVRAIGGADLSSIRVGDVPATLPPGTHHGASGWVCRAHLEPGWKKQNPVVLDRRTGTKSSKRVRLKTLPSLDAVTEAARHRDRRIRAREMDSVKNRETDYLLRSGMVINIRIGQGSGLSSDTLIYSDRLRFKTKRSYMQELYPAKKKNVAERVRNYLVQVTASEHGHKSIAGWVSRKLLKRA